MKDSSNILLAIAASLLIHAIVLAGLLYHKVYDDDDLEVLAERAEENDLMLLDFVELSADDPLAESADPAANLIANQESARTSERRSSSQQSEAAMKEAVVDDLRALERQLFEEAAQDNPTFESETQETSTERGESEFDWFDKAYEGQVQISYSLDGRSHQSLPNPGYRCKASGKITINIDVGQQGEILGVDLNPSQTTTSNVCLIEEAMKYAQQSSFASSFSWPKKHRGTITYIFSAQ